MAVVLRLSRERVRQIEAVALRKLKLIERIRTLAPRGQAWPLIEGLARKPVADYREVVQQLKREREQQQATADEGTA